MNFTRKQKKLFINFNKFMDKWRLKFDKVGFTLSGEQTITIEGEKKPWREVVFGEKNYESSND